MRMAGEMELCSWGSPDAYLATDVRQVFQDLPFRHPGVVVGLEAQGSVGGHAQLEVMTWEARGRMCSAGVLLSPFTPPPRRSVHDQDRMLGEDRGEQGRALGGHARRGGPPQEIRVDFGENLIDLGHSDGFQVGVVIRLLHQRHRQSSPGAGRHPQARGYHHGFRCRPAGPRS
jgi:hypothetical protein